jgi:murein DD-endopeptidase MepM/ murein hydrolase activator NlpD
VRKVGKGGRLAGGLLSLALLAVPPAAGGGVASAAPPRPAVLAQVGDTPADEARLLKEVEASLERKRNLDAKVKELDAQLLDTQSELRTSESQLFAVLSKERGAEVKLSQLREQKAAAEQALRDHAVAAYIGAASGSSVVDLLRTDNLGALAAKQSYMRVVADTQADLILARERLTDQTNDLLEELQATKARAKRERDAIASHKAQIQSDRDSQAAVRHQVSVEIANHDVLLQEVIARKSEFQAIAEELEAQSAAVAVELGRRVPRPDSEAANTGASSSSSSTSSGDLGSPLNGLRVTSRYGYRVHPIYGTTRLHTGVDLSANTGAPIRAAGDGVVVSAGWLGGYGNATVVDHGGGLATLYAHQSALLVSQGDRVDKGDVIGRVGCTGSCTGPHLHYEVRIGGNPVDPTPYL